MKWGLSEAADYIKQCLPPGRRVSLRHLREIVGSGKVELGAGGIENGELERFIELRRLDPRFYAVKHFWISTAYASYLCAQAFASLTPEAIAGAWHRGRLLGRRQGNSLEVEYPALCGYVWERYGVTLPPIVAFADAGVGTGESSRATASWSPSSVTERY